MVKFMMRSHVFRRNMCFIGLVTLIHSALLVMAVGCSLTHADGSQRHQRHHHSEEQSSNHNVLCALACHATVDNAEASAPPPTAAELMVGPADLASHQLGFLQPRSGVQTRAPPSIPFIRLG